MSNDSTQKTLNGKWLFKDSKGSADAQLLLEDNGDRITGVAYYPEGTGIIEGEHSGDSAILTIAFTSAKVLAKWLPAALAEQVLGITSCLTVKLGGDEPLSCSYQGFYVSFDLRDNSITKRFDADTPGVENIHPPRLGLLSKK